MTECTREGAWKARIEDFVSTERCCCSFFRTEVTYEPALGPSQVILTGPAGTKQFIEEAFAVPTP